MHKPGTFTTIGDVIHLEGHLNEHALIQTLSQTTADPLKLNFRAVTAISSLGMKKLVDLMKDVTTRTVEFHECPGFFVELVNAVPSLVGHRREVVKSVYLQYQCKSCGKGGDLLIGTSEIKVTSGVVNPPLRRCDKCGAPTAFKGDANDALLFLTEGW